LKKNFFFFAKSSFANKDFFALQYTKVDTVNIIKKAYKLTYIMASTFGTSSRNGA
jgi:hypothetical protein